MNSLHENDDDTSLLPFIGKLDGRSKKRRSLLEKAKNIKSKSKNKKMNIKKKTTVKSKTTRVSSKKIQKKKPLKKKEINGNFHKESRNEYSQGKRLF